MSSQLKITVARTHWARFSLLLQEGVWIKGPLNISLEQFLTKCAGIPKKDLTDLVQTVFLNGQTVDDLTKAQVANEDIIALSASMPGLLGATLRKGGYYAGLRQEISHHGRDLEVADQNGRVRIKMFNILLRQLGPGVLAHGIWLEPDRLQTFLKDRSEDFWRDCSALTLNDQALIPQALLSMKIDAAQIQLIVSD